MYLALSIKKKKDETHVENSIDESKSYLDTMLDYFAHPVDDGGKYFYYILQKFLIQINI